MPVSRAILVVSAAVLAGCMLTAQGLSGQSAAAPQAASNGAFVVGTAQTAPTDESPAPAQTAKPVPKPAPKVHLLPNPSPAQIQYIIRAFTTNEKMFRELLKNDYVYTESILMQELNSDGQPVGDYQQVNDITFSDGQKQIVCTYCPQPTLTRIGVTEQDITDMFNMNMYTLSIDQLPEYNITYVDHQPLDEVTVYVFDVAPKKIVKGQRYFEGKVYVDDHDLMIVKSDGRVVPNEYDKHGNPTNVFLPFQVWREKIDGKYWFPVYTLMQGSIPGAAGEPAVPMKMVIQFKNYKRFRATTRILSVQALPGGTPPAAAPTSPTSPKAPPPAPSPGH